MKKLLIDCDIGVDDAQALMVALATPDVEILGITCSYGNVSLKNVLQNTLRVLKVCDKMDIPVYRGCAAPLVGKKRNASDYHGKDGLGDVPDDNPQTLDLIQDKKAVHAIIQTVNKNPGEVSLVALGPLTNLAIAINVDPNLHKKLKGLYIMGGNTESRGNTTSCGEFNFVADPEAAHVVLERFTCPTYIVSWEFTCRNSLPWNFVDKWLAIDTDKAKFVKAISEISMKKSRSPEYQKEITEGKGFNPCDTFAMAAALDDTFVTESEQVAVTVELNGAHTRGMMVMDYIELMQKEHKVNIVKKVDMNKLRQMLMSALK